MTSFMFNFTSYNMEKKVEDKSEVRWHLCKEILPTNQNIVLDTMAKYAKMFICGNVEIGHVVHNIQLKDISGTDIDIAEKNHSDLISGTYEGGLKIWECTYDLIQYLEDHKEISIQNSKILDLGCGVGILGIYALFQGGTVVFQDYNEEVIENVTIPNVLLNMEDDGCPYNLEMCKFYSGDWEYFNEKLEDNLFDIILTSETIYNIDNYEKLLKLFNGRLSKQGVILVAAKTCYFGVGGGVREFEKAISNVGLSSEVVWRNVSGIQREIIKIYK